ncbi:MAG: Gfo/Idh/MocA family oxidoreductase [Candidatus Sumerlaeota bacterium]|nr:Gfo/Idh/MocA family oxidoreductase [Candidatus Sumerlaeota bacterium]
MNEESIQEEAAGVSRRAFLSQSAGMSAAAAAVMATGNFAYAAGSDRIKVGLIGCGGRGTQASGNCLEAAPNVEIYAMGDLFQDRLDGSFKSLKGGAAGKKNKAKAAAKGEKGAKSEKGAKGGKAEKGKATPAPTPEPETEDPEAANAAQRAERVTVAPDRMFVGWDAYQKVIASGVDMVILATPPHFRPIHLRAAVEAGKHVFMEKPVAVDPLGIHSVLESGEMAKTKGLAIVAGTQRRHQAGYIETIKRIQDGTIGDLVAGQFYWNQGFLWKKERQPEWTDMEYQLRNWLYYTWLSGDHICEQHVHNLDVMNWVFGGPPVKCMGMGGRKVRIEPIYGDAFDHFAVEYEYPNGVRLLSMCRQIDGCAHRVAERVAGTKGSSNCSGQIDGETPFKFQGKSINPYVQEHIDLVRGIMDGKPLNEAKQVAESTMTAIMGRMSAYTGNEVSWKWVMEASKLDLTPPKYAFGPAPAVEVAVPGKTKLI